MNRKSLITAALVAAGIIYQASAADQVVYVTGSTAFRSIVYSAMTDTTGKIFDQPGTVHNGVTAPAITESERGGSAANGANYMLFHGNINGTALWIDCAWSGSEAGLASIANVAIDNDGIPLFGAPETWLKADGSVAAGFLAAQPTAGELEASSHQGDIALADTSQDSALPPIQRVANTSTDLKSYGQLGVVTFTWLKNNNAASGASAAKTAWNSVTNISTFQAQALFGAGALTADFFTSSSADITTFVYLVGRNKGSGTRANVLNDCTFGLNTPVNQFSIGGNLTGTPDGTLTLASCGDNGYESGGAVTTALGVAGSTSNADPFNAGHNWFAIGYASTGDAQKNGVTTANWLTENGVFESNGAIKAGQYSFWGYENLFGRHNISGFTDTVGGKILTGVQAQVGNSGSVDANHDSAIHVTLMNCVKSTDFSFPTHN
jgi:hypothetical protein